MFKKYSTCLLSFGYILAMENRSKKSDDVREISLSLIDENLSRFRLPNPRSIKGIVQSLETYGQLVPVVVGIREDRYELIDGFKRLRASQQLDRSFLTASIFDGPEHTFKVALMHLNRGIHALGDFEEALVLSSLFTEDCLTQKEIAVLFGRHKSWVSRRISLVERLSEEVISQIKLGLVSISKGRELARLPRGNQGKALQTIVQAHLTCKETAHLVSLLLERPGYEHKNILNDPKKFLAPKMKHRTSNSRLSKEARPYHETLLAMKDLLRSMCLEKYSSRLESMTRQDRQHILSVVTHLETSLSAMKQCTHNVENV